MLHKNASRGKAKMQKQNQEADRKIFSIFFLSRVNPLG